MLATIEQALTSIQCEPDFEQAAKTLLKLKCWLYKTEVVVELKQEAFNLEVSEKIHGARVMTGWCDLDKLWISHI